MKHLAYASHRVLRVAVCAALSPAAAFVMNPRPAMAQVPPSVQEQPAGSAEKATEAQRATEAEQKKEAERAEAERQREAQQADRRYEEERPGEFYIAGFGGYTMCDSGPNAIICNMPPAAWPPWLAKMPFGIAQVVTLGASTTLSLIHLSTVDGVR